MDKGCDVQASCEADKRAIHYPVLSDNMRLNKTSTIQFTPRALLPLKKCNIVGYLGGDGVDRGHNVTNTRDSYSRLYWSTVTTTVLSQ